MAIASGCSVLILLLSFVAGFLLPLSVSSAASVTYGQLHCSLCINALDEIEYAVEQTKEDFTVQTKWRVDDKRKIPYKRTEFRILEIMEHEVSPKLEKYGLCAAVDEKSGKNVKRYCREDWRFGNYSKLSKALEKDVKERYSELIEEHMEEITLLFHRANDITEIKQKVCVDTTKICRKLPDYAKTSTAAPNPNAPPPFEEPQAENKTETVAPTQTTDAATLVEEDTDGSSSSTSAASKKDEL